MTPRSTQKRLEREAQLASQTCRGCGRLGSLVEVLPATAKEPAWLTCSGCSWHGQSTHCEQEDQLVPLGHDQIRLGKRETVALGQPTSVSSEVLDCHLLEIHREHEPGSSGGAGRPPKLPPPPRRAEQEPLGFVRAREATESELLDPKDEHLNVRCTRRDKRWAAELAAGLRMTLTEVVSLGLRLVDLLTARQWSAWCRDSGMRPEEIVAEALNEWAAKHLSAAARIP